MYSEDSRMKDQVGLIVRAIHSEEVSVRELAIVQLSVLGPKAIPYICSALSNLIRGAEPSYNGDQYNRKEDSKAAERGIDGLLKALGIFADPNTITNITEGLPRPNALEALSKIGTDDALSILIDQFPLWAKKDKRQIKFQYSHITPEFIKEVFARFGDRGSDALVDLLGRGVPLTQEIISDVLAVTGDSKMVPALVNALKVGQTPVKLAALEALRKMNAKETVPLFIEELSKINNSFLDIAKHEQEIKSFSDSREDLPSNYILTGQKLVLAISELGTLADWIKVLSYSRTTKINLNEIKLKILGLGEEAVPSLTKLLQDPDKQTQRLAAEMIANIKGGGGWIQRNRYRERLQKY